MRNVTEQPLEDQQFDCQLGQFSRTLVQSCYRIEAIRLRLKLSGDLSTIDSTSAHGV